MALMGRLQGWGVTVCVGERTPPCKVKVVQERSPTTRKLVVSLGIPKCRRSFTVTLLDWPELRWEDSSWEAMA